MKSPPFVSGCCAAPAQTIIRPKNWATMLPMGNAVNAAATALHPFFDQRVKSPVMLPLSEKLEITMVSAAAIVMPLSSPL